MSRKIEYIEVSKEEFQIKKALYEGDREKEDFHYIERFYINKEL